MLHPQPVLVAGLHLHRDAIGSHLGHYISSVSSQVLKTQVFSGRHRGAIQHSAAVRPKGAVTTCAGIEFHMCFWTRLHCQAHALIYPWPAVKLLQPTTEPAWALLCIQVRRLSVNLDMSKCTSQVDPRRRQRQREDRRVPGHPAAAAPHDGPLPGRGVRQFQPPAAQGASGTLNPGPLPLYPDSHPDLTPTRSPIPDPDPNAAPARALALAHIPVT